MDLVIPDTINTVHTTVLAPKSKESQAMGPTDSSNRGYICFSSLSGVQQDPPYLELMGDIHQSRLGGVEELAL